MHKEFNTNQGDKIIYYQYNQHRKKNVLFIHGNLSDHTWWNQIIEYFNDFHIFILELRGFGKSSFINKKCSLQDYANEVNDFCKYNKLDKLTVLGWSLGGLITMKLAEINGQLVDKIILVCSVNHIGFQFLDDNNKKLNKKQDLRQLPKFSFMDRVIHTQNFQQMKKIFQNVLFKYLPNNIPQNRKNQLIKTPFKQQNYLDIIQLTANVHININKIQAKWLIINGKEDPVTPPQLIIPTLKQLDKYQKTHTYILMQNAGHMIPIQHSQDFSMKVINFVSQ